MSSRQALIEDISEQKELRDLLSAKLGALKKERILETRVEEKFRLQHKIDEAQAELEIIDHQLEALQDRLAGTTADARTSTVVHGDAQDLPQASDRLVDMLVTYWSGRLDLKDDWDLADSLFQLKKRVAEEIPSEQKAKASRGEIASALRSLMEMNDLDVMALAKVISQSIDQLAPNRFHVALSFPGEHRAFVCQVAEALAKKLTRDRVFYDDWYEVELLGAGGDLKLQSMYEQADLVVPFFSEHYSKPWCSLEWETIRGILLHRRKDDAVIPVHLDDTNIPGWSAVNFGIEVRGRSPQQIAEMILQALALRQRSADRAARK